MPTWEDLDAPKRAEPQADEFAKHCALVFNAGPGVRLLEMLRDMTIEKQLPVGANDRALSDLEAQRRLVRRIEVAAKQGIPAARPVPKTA